MNKMRPFEMSALAISLDGYEAELAPYRRRYTQDGAKGMPAHITVLYPFCSSHDWSSDAAGKLSAIISTVQPFRLTINRLGRFPQSGILYLDPFPGDAVISLIRLVAEAFPDYPPYEGNILLDRIKPHATIAASPPAHDLEAVEDEFAESVLPLLPNSLLVKNLWLFVKSSEKWQKHTRFIFGEPDAGPGQAGAARSETRP